MLRWYLRERPPRHQCSHDSGGADGWPACGWFSFGPGFAPQAICDVSDVIVEVIVGSTSERCRAASAALRTQHSHFAGGYDRGERHRNAADGAGGEPTEVVKAVAKLIGGNPGAACLQLGIGGMPAEYRRLDDRESDLKGLGVRHTEMYVDAAD